MTDELPDVAVIPLDPASRLDIRPDKFGKPIPATGVPLESLGHTWILAYAGLSPALTDQRDDLFSVATLNGEYMMDLVRQAAYRLLRVNYDLTLEEVVVILDAAEPKALAEAVWHSVIPHDMRAGDKSYTAWARSSLLAAGLVPEAIPAADVGPVLRQLMATGRAAPFADFIAASSTAAALAEFERGL